MAVIKLERFIVRCDNCNDEVEVTVSGMWGGEDAIEKAGFVSRYLRDLCESCAKKESPGESSRKRRIKRAKTGRLSKSRNRD